MTINFVCDFHVVIDESRIEGIKISVNKTLWICANFCQVITEVSRVIIPFFHLVVEIK